MKGRDGLAQHPWVTGINNVGNETVLAAPGAGLQICVYKLQMSFGALWAGQLQDLAAVTYWQGSVNANVPLLDADDCGLFTLPDNQSLHLVQPGVIMSRYNITYEIRPTGM